MTLAGQLCHCLPVSSAVMLETHLHGPRSDNQAGKVAEAGSEGQVTTRASAQGSAETALG